MNTINKTNSRQKPLDKFSGKSLIIRKICKSELAIFKELSGKHHYMGEGHAGGDTMRLVAELDGKWVALFLWGSAAYHLKDREEFIGWSAPQRAQRQKLVVQNRRFVLLTKKGEYPNLASKVLGKVVRELPDMWFEEFEYQPLIAETFSDIEAREGTCYKASGWIALGKTKGFSRHRADYYVPNDRPKKLWVRELRKGAAELLRSSKLPTECLEGAKSDDYGVSPFKNKQIESLHAALCRVEDPRASNCIFHVGAMLSIVAMGICSGHRDLVAIIRFSKRMTQKQRIALALPRFKKGGSVRKTPSYSAMYNLLTQMDLDQFAELLSDWLKQHEGSLPAALSVDGKFIKNTVGIVSLVDHETGVPRAMAKASQKKGEGKDCEMKVIQRMICREKDLTNILITADALNCQKETMRDIVERGGDFLIQLKDNQPNANKEATKLIEELSPLLPKWKRGTEG